MTDGGIGRYATSVRCLEDYQYSRDLQYKTGALVRAGSCYLIFSVDSKGPPGGIHVRWFWATVSGTSA